MASPTPRGFDAFVLAGGRSTRMGSDKARAPWGDPPVPLAIAVATALRDAGTAVALIRRRDDGLPWVWPTGAPIPVVWEPDDGPVHPLRGVVTALRAARTPLVAVAPCDVPHLTAASWRRLIAAAPAIAVSDDHPHALVAVLSSGLADRAEALARDGAPAGALVRDTPRVTIPREELRDIDDPSGLAGDPISRLLGQFPWLDDAARARVATGERTRLAARGIVAVEERP